MRKLSLSILALTILGLVACGGEEETEATCENDCFIAPASECVEAQMYSFTAPGTCVEGQCLFQPTATECIAGCDGGRCLPPCDRVVCDSPPSATCLAQMLLTFESIGLCQLDTGDCDYTPLDVNCGLDDMVCNDTGDTAICQEPDPTCLDGVYNGDEVDVDCGGECGLCPDERRCRQGPDCESGICQNRICQSGTCRDLVANGLESDVDCGGLDCLRCRAGGVCTAELDCVSGVCADGTCQASSCSDGAINGTETDTDCGGPDCPGCLNGLVCEANGDCTSHVCTNARCTISDCRDALSNGDETDIDCGGADCVPCEGGHRCEVGSDCASTVCGSGVCEVATCSDGLRNGDETDFDCGGTCADCSAGGICDVNGDCDSGLCTAGQCSLATCTDGARGARETDVDCGGVCLACADLGGCATNSDCASLLCSGSICRAGTCTDSRRNQSESDVDCGGPCRGCGVGETCDSDIDCTSGSCFTGVCAVLPRCDDLLTNGQESDIDCGGSVCQLCNPGRGCRAGSDCFTGSCVDGTCGGWPSCRNDIRDGAETDVDCGGLSCQPCVAGACLTNTDCTTGACETGFCSVASCEDEIENGVETDVDCGGSECDLRCELDERCRGVADCADGLACTGFCTTPRCDDGVLGGTELSTDCGGDCGLDEYCLPLCAEGVGVGFVGSDSPDSWAGDATITGLGSALDTPAGCGSALGREVAFEFTAPADGIYIVSTIAGPEAVIYALGYQCDPTTSLVCESTSGAGAAELELELTAAERVFLVVDPLVDSEGEVVRIGIELEGGASCDDGAWNGTESALDCGGECAPCAECSDGVPVLSRSFMFYGSWSVVASFPSASGATGTCSPQSAINSESVFLFRAPRTGTFSVTAQETFGGDLPAEFALYARSACDGTGEEIACVVGDSSVLQLDLGAGEQAYIYADGVTPAGGFIGLELLIFESLD